jgi:hypothetical protein
MRQVVGAVLYQQCAVGVRDGGATGKALFALGSGRAAGGLAVQCGLTLRQERAALFRVKPCPEGLLFGVGG